MATPKKVLHVIDSLDLGGAQTFLLDLVKHHDQTRYLPEVATMHGMGVYAKVFEDAGVPVQSLSPVRFPPFYIPNFWKLLRSGNYDILHFHLFGANLCAKPLAIAAGHPAIIVHDQCNDASRENNPMLLAADAFWNRCSDRVIAVSESTRRYLLDREDLDDAKVTMIPNGIDTSVFKPAGGDERDRARFELGLPIGAFVIGGVGRLVSQKNFSLFLKIASNVLRVHTGVIFVIAGTGPLESQLSEEAATLGIAERVRFLGHVSDRVGLYRALDALMMTSDFEGTPMTLLEAMASGLPVVASAVDGIAEVCTHREDALLASVGQTDEFEEYCRLIISDKSRCFDLGAAARRTILERYEISALARRVGSVYEEVLESSH